MLRNSKGKHVIPRGGWQTGLAGEVITTFKAQNSKHCQPNKTTPGVKGWVSQALIGFGDRIATWLVCDPSTHFLPIPHLFCGSLSSTIPYSPINSGRFFPLMDKIEVFSSLSAFLQNNWNTCINSQVSGKAWILAFHLHLFTDHPAHVCGPLVGIALGAGTHRRS